MQLFSGMEPLPINRDVRQGDSISTKIFKAALEDIFKTLKWDIIGINNREYLNNLWFADDTVLLAEKIEDRKNANWSI